MNACQRPLFACVETMPKPQTRMQFFSLKSPQDLFAKLEGDLLEFQASPGDARLAFNFFVTAEHLPDWLQGDARGRLKHDVLLRIATHLANGAKHFEVSRHESVVEARSEGYAEDGSVEDDYVQDVLCVAVSAEEAKELGSSTIDAVHLACRVLELWRPIVHESAAQKR